MVLSLIMFNLVSRLFSLSRSPREKKGPEGPGKEKEPGNKVVTMLTLFRLGGGGGGGEVPAPISAFENFLDI